MGQFFEGAFIGKYPNDPRGSKRILKSVGGKVKELLISVSEKMRKYVEQSLAPDVESLFAKNFDKAVDDLQYFWRGK